MEGCKNLCDLDTAINDSDRAVKAARRMKIAEENIKVFTDASLDDFATWWKGMLSKWLRIVNENKKIFIFTYCTGHGVSMNDQQCFLVNSVDRNLLKIEEYIHTLLQCSDGFINALTIFDLCRTNVKKYRGLDVYGDMP